MYRYLIAEGSRADMEVLRTVPAHGQPSPSLGKRCVVRVETCPGISLSQSDAAMVKIAEALPDLDLRILTRLPDGWWELVYYEFGEEVDRTEAPLLCSLYDEDDEDDLLAIAVRKGELNY
jgi:hypothetical protein